MSYYNYWSSSSWSYSGHWDYTPSWEKYCPPADPADAEISGRYFVDTNNNNVDDHDGDEPGVVGAKVWLLDQYNNPIAETTTDANGDYSFDGLTAGSYKVSFQDPSDVSSLTSSNGFVTADQGNSYIDSDVTNTDWSGNGKTQVITVSRSQVINTIDAGVKPAPAPQGEISGRYFLDTNNNNVDDNDGNEPGVAGAKVWLLDEHNNPIAETTTDANGQYCFTELKEGNYKVSFEDPSQVASLGDTDGYVVADQGDGHIDSDVTSTDNGNGRTDVIRLGKDCAITTIDAGVKLAPPAPKGEISGRYFLDTNNNNVDDNDGNEPGVAGAKVWLLDEHNNPIAETTTDANGQYCFTELKEGNYKVSFEDPSQVASLGDTDGYVVADQGNGYIDSDVTSTDNGNGRTDVIRLGKDCAITTIDAGVKLAPPAPKGEVSGRYFIDTNNNNVDDHDGNEPGVAGAKVWLLDEHNNPIAETTTDANGQYCFTELESGDYKVSFEDPSKIADLPPTDGYVVADQGNAYIDSDVTNTNNGNGVTSVFHLPKNGVINTQDAGIKLAPAPQGEIGGRYFIDTNNNNVDDNDGDEPAVVGAKVWLLDEHYNIIAETTTDSNGNYSFDNLASGQYRVMFDDPSQVANLPATDGFVSHPHQGNIYIDSDVEGNWDGYGYTPEITLGNNEVINRIDAGVKLAAPKGEISGRYFIDTNNNNIDDNDGDEPAVVGAKVWLLDEHHNVIAETTTDTNGEYSFTELEAGNYKVSFENPSKVNGLTAPDGFVVADQGDYREDSDVTYTADNGNGKTDVICLGKDSVINTVDAGIKLSPIPTAENDEAEACINETISVDVLDNDSVTQSGSKPVLLNVTAVNGQAIVDGGAALNIGGVLVSLVAGELVFDGSTAHAALVAGESTTDTFTYTVTDTNGNTAEASVEVTFKGETDTIEKVAALLPETAGLQIQDNALDANNGNGISDEAFTAQLTNAGDLSGTFSAAYCLDVFAEVLKVGHAEDINTAVTANANVVLADKDELTTAQAEKLGVGINGEAAVDNLDLLNWIINQDFTNTDNGDGTGENYTDSEVQGAIWSLTDGNLLSLLGFADGIKMDNPALGTADNAKEILDLALANGEGFEAGQDDLVGVFVEPTDSFDQQFLVAMDLFETC